jgi:hypothetical protein
MPAKITFSLSERVARASQKILPFLRLLLLLHLAWSVGQPAKLIKSRLDSLQVSAN